MLGYHLIYCGSEIIIVQVYPLSVLLKIRAPVLNQTVLPSSNAISTEPGQFVC